MVWYLEDTASWYVLLPAQIYTSAERAISLSISLIHRTHGKTNAGSLRPVTSVSETLDETEDSPNLSSSTHHFLPRECLSLSLSFAPPILRRHAVSNLHVWRTCNSSSFTPPPRSSPRLIATPPCYLVHHIHTSSMLPRCHIS